MLRTLNEILTVSGTPDVTRMGWPTLRAGFPFTTFLNSVRQLRATAAKRAPEGKTPVMTVIGAGNGHGRTVTALNVALTAARDGAKVLMIDADHAQHALSDKVAGVGKKEASRLSWLSIGTKAARAIQTVNGISILPVAADSDAKTSDAICKAIAQARAVGGYDLMILDGPAMPWSDADRKLIDVSDGLVAMLPAQLDINDCMEEIITALGGTERKLIGVVLNELQPAAPNHQRGKQYA